MDLLTTAEQDEIVSSSAAFLAAHMPMARTRELFEAGTVPAVSDDAWAAAAGLGWFALGLSEEGGGVGFGLAEEALLFREIGRAGAAGPFLSTVLAARVAASGGEPTLAAEIAAGLRVGLVVPGSLDAIGEDGAVTGDVQLIDTDATGLALAVTPSLAAIVAVGSLRDVTDVAALDPTVRLSRALGTGAAPVAAVELATDPVEWRGHVLAAAMLTGIVEWCRDTAVAHASTRVQFDQPIGVHQAIKHPCADVAVQAALAYAQTLFAALAIDEGRPDAELQALSAHLAAASAAELATGATLQIMGGMGYTHEHDVHLYLKRSELLAHVFGVPRLWRERVLQLPEAV